MNRPGSAFEQAATTRPDSPREKEVRNLLGLVYTNVPKSQHDQVPQVVNEVVTQFEQTVGRPFDHTMMKMAVQEVRNRLSGGPETEVLKALAETQVKNSPASVSDQTQQAVSEVSEQLPEKPAAKPKAPQKPAECPLPHVVSLNTDVRELVAKAYSPEDLKQHNPFNGHGGLEHLSAHDGNPELTPEESLKFKLHSLVRQGASREEVNAIATAAMGKGLSLETVYNVLQEVYSEYESTGSSA